MMKRKIILATLICVASLSFAVPAKKEWRTFKQPDGTTIELMLVGDENLHYFLTRDNVPVVSDANNQYCYAKAAGFTILSTGVMAHEEQLRNTTEKTFVSSVADVESVRPYRTMKGVRGTKTMRRANRANGIQEIGEPDHPQYLGKKKGLVILANFSDRKFYDYSEEDNGYLTWLRYDAMTNEVGYTNEAGAIGSVHDYYHDQSYGKFDLTFDVMGPVNLDKSYAYYGKNFNGDDMNAPEMIVECCKVIDDQVDFTEYDWDGDGVVEEVFVLYAGYGEATNGGAQTIWPHMWELSAACVFNENVPKDFMLDDVIIDVYACSNELYGFSGTTEMGLGVICHEFSHCLGLPDLYDTSYHGNFGMGSWDILDDGSYNGPSGLGWVPAGYSSYERNYAGWLKFTELKNNRRIINQKPLTSRGNGYVIYNDSCKSEYYLLENRAQESWDSFIPGEGLLIIHVDYDQDIWYNNIVNTTGANNDHQRLTLFHASNSNRGGHEAYPFNGNDSLTDDSTPAAKLYNPNIDGSYLMHKPITQITRNEETGFVSFLFKNENHATVDIEDAIIGGDEVVDVYSLDGVRVMTNTSAANVFGLRSGTYVIKNRQGHSKKIVIK